MTEDVHWPNGARCAAVLTFDVDADSNLSHVEENRNRPKLLSMGRYGPLRGVPRILDMLDRQDVKATFFIPGVIIDEWPDRIREIASRGHEIAVHGYYHVSTETLSPEEQRDAHERSLEAALRVTGRRPVGVRPPGEYSPDTLRIVHDMGFLYDSNMRGDDRPYRVELDGKKTDLIEIAPMWELDDFPYFYFGYSLGSGPVRIQSPQTAYDAWTTEFDGYYRDGLCYQLMLHPQLIGKPGRTLMLEKVIEYIKGHDNVWFATCEEIARWWLAEGEPVE